MELFSDVLYILDDLSIAESNKIYVRYIPVRIAFNPHAIHICVIPISKL